MSENDPTLTIGNASQVLVAPEEGHTLIIRNPKYRCPKHGDIGEQTLGITFYGSPSLSKMFCLFCWAKHLEETCEQVGEIK